MVDPIENRIPPELSSSQSREIQQVDRRQAEEPGKAEIKGDEASLSKEARLLQRVRRAIDEMPDVREDKIAALRQQIQEGAYQIDVEALIDALIGGHQAGTGSGE